MFLIPIVQMDLMKETEFKFSASVIALPFLFLLTMWAVFWFEVRFKTSLYDFGIYPRTLEGMKGLLFSPFLHGNLQHLYNNSIPIFLLVMALRYFYREQSLSVLGYGILVSGFGTWLIGRESMHIGASGLIYVLVSFIFFKGIQSGYYRLVALSLTIVVLYGGTVWYLFPSAEENISWEGHLAGFITGFLLSYFVKTQDYQKPLKYDWEQPDFDPSQDPFMKHFDENGNFVPTPKPDPLEQQYTYFISNLPVLYTFSQNRPTEQN